MTFILNNYDTNYFITFNENYEPIYRVYANRKHGDATVELIFQKWRQLFFESDGWRLYGVDHAPLMWSDYDFMDIQL